MMYMPDRAKVGSEVCQSRTKALLYASAQFFRYQEAERFVTERLSDPQAVALKIKEKEQP